jgi:hypothetical protein
MRCNKKFDDFVEENPGKTTNFVLTPFQEKRHCFKSSNFQRQVQLCCFIPTHASIALIRT